MLETLWRKGNQPSYTVENVNWLQPLWRPVWRFLKELKIELLHDPAIPFLGIYLEKFVELLHDPAIPFLSIYLEKFIIKKIHALQYSLQHSLQ